MIICPKCGVEVKEDDNFCTQCGGSLAKTNESFAQKNSRAQQNRYAGQRSICFDEGKRDYFGLFSFGIFLLTVGIVFSINRNLVSDLQLWIEWMANNQVLTRPPERLIASAKLFFGLIGLSNFFLAGIKLIIDKVMRRVLSDVLSGVALMLFAYLLHLYGRYSLSWQMVLAVEAVAVGLLIILYSIVRYILLDKPTWTS